MNRKFVFQKEVTIFAAPKSIYRLMNDDFIIPLNGLPATGSTFRWHAGKEFLGSFDNTEIKDADIQASCSVRKSGNWFGVDMLLEGTVTVECDRCLDDLTIPVDRTVKLSIKFTSDATQEQKDLIEEEGDREVVCFPSEESSVDLRQIAYDYICLSLPMVRVHPEGECNPDVIRYLSGHVQEEEVDQKASDSNSPFAGLRDLLDGN